MKIPSPKPGTLRCTDWRPKFLTELLARTFLTHDTGSRWLPLPSGSAPIRQRGKECVCFPLSLLGSGASCLLSLTKIIQYLNASRTHAARAAGLCFSSPSVPALPPVCLGERYAALASSHYCDATLLWRKGFKTHGGVSPMKIPHWN